MSRNALGLIVLILAIAISSFAANGKVEPIDAFSDQSAPESIKKSLEAKGSRVTLTDGAIVCEIWLRSGLASGSKSETQGAAYTGLSVSAMVGVINFPKTSSDFRGQAIKAGAYTMRYAVHPLDGNHLGISPIRDFLVLIPVSADQNPETEYKFDDLMKMSMKASGTNHPAVISLASADPNQSPPSVSENEHGHLIFAAKLKTQSAAEMTIAFVVKGRAEQ